MTLPVPAIPPAVVAPDVVAEVREGGTTPDAGPPDRAATEDGLHAVPAAAIAPVASAPETGHGTASPPSSRTTSSRVPGRTAQRASAERPNPMRPPGGREILMARAPRPPSPEKAAIKRLGETLQRGATPDRMVREVLGIVDGLRSAGDEETVREWLETMRDTFAEGAEAAAEAVSDVDSSDAAGTRRAKQSLAAFEATRDALDAALRAG